MKDKDRWFEEAMATLQEHGINLAAASHWQDHELLAVEGFSRSLLAGWRRMFFSNRGGTLEMAAPRDVERPDTHARVIRMRPERGGMAPRKHASQVHGNAADTV